MANYDPPTENITSFNTLLFNQPEVQLTRGEADLLYLSKVSTDISTAGSTTFNGAVGVGGNITGSSLIQSNTTSPSTNLLYNNLFSGSTLTMGTSTSTNTINGSTTFNQLIVGSSNLNTNTINGNGNTGTKSFYTGLTGTLNIGQSTTTLINIKAPTTFDLTTTFSTLIKFTDTFSPFTNNTQISQDVLLFNIKNNMTNGTIVLKALNSAGATKSALIIGGASVDVLDELPLKVRQIQSSSTASASHTLFDNMISGGVLTIGGTASANTIRGDSTFSQNVIFSGRLNMNASTYSFPFASNLSLGYYLKATGTATSITTATPTSILTTASIPVGVWRIDFSVINVVGATGAGTITSAQSFVSATNNGAVATAVDFTGSVVRSHISEVYGNNDIQEITSSFTYNQSTAGVLYLNIVRSFSTGTYLFTGELSITRIA
jgi:hypothetical protein